MVGTDDSETQLGKSDSVPAGPTPGIEDWKLPREIGSSSYMPTTLPGLSVTKAAELVQTQD